MARTRRGGCGCLTIVLAGAALVIGGWLSLTAGWFDRHLLAAGWQIGQPCPAMFVIAPSIRETSGSVLTSSLVRDRLREQLGFDWLGDPAATGVDPGSSLWGCRYGGNDPGSVFSMRMADGTSADRAMQMLSESFGAPTPVAGREQFVFADGVAVEQHGDRLWIGRSASGDGLQAASLIDRTKMGPASLRSARWRDAMDLDRGWQIAWHATHSVLSQANNEMATRVSERHQIGAAGGAIYVEEGQSRAVARLVGGESSLVSPLFADARRNDDRLSVLRSTPLFAFHMQADPASLAELGSRFGELLVPMADEVAGLPGVRGVLTDLGAAIERDATGEFASAVLQAPLVGQGGVRAVSFVGLRDTASVTAVLDRAQSLSLGLVSRRTVGDVAITGVGVAGQHYEAAVTSDGLWFGAGANVLDSFVVGDAPGELPDVLANALDVRAPLVAYVDLAQIASPLSSLAGLADETLSSAVASMRTATATFETEGSAGVLTVTIER